MDTYQAKARGKSGPIDLKQPSFRPKICFFDSQALLLFLLSLLLFVIVFVVAVVVCCCCCCCCCCWAAALTGLMACVFTHMRNFLLLLLFHPPCLKLKAQIPASRPKYQPWGPDHSFQAQIPAFKSKSQPRNSNRSHKAQFPTTWPNSSLKAQITAWRLKSLLEVLHPRGELRRGRRRFPICVKDWVIKPFGAAALHST